MPDRALYPATDDEVIEVLASALYDVGWCVRGVDDAMARATAVRLLEGLLANGYQILKAAVAAPGNAGQVGPSKSWIN